MRPFDVRGLGRGLRLEPSQQLACLRFNARRDLAALHRHLVTQRVQRLRRIG